MSISSYRSPKTQVKASHIEGRGLFVIQPIRKGEIVTMKGGHIIDGKTLQDYEDVINDGELQIADDFYLAPLSREEADKVMMFLNHSCEPNVGVHGQIMFVAMRNIKKGEELTIDYAMIDNGSQKMPCNCGKKSCRRVITGKDWQKKELQQKYKGYFAYHIQEKIA